MIPTRTAQGLFPYGIDCRFREWSKLRASFCGQVYPLSTVHKSDYWDRVLTSLSRGLSRVMFCLPRHRKPTRIYGYLRKRNSSRKQRSVGFRPHAFVLECYSYEQDRFPWFFQIDHDNAPIFRHRFDINSGWNRYVIPYSDMIPAEYEGESVELFFSSDFDSSFRLIITWADFVVFNEPWSIESLSADGSNADFDRADTQQATSKALLPARKTKCLAWDLDNTLWNGTLIEDGADNLELRAEAVRAIQQLDARGVIHTIVSKNTYSEAWEVVKRYGLDAYFIHPAIDWNSKSQNLREIADRINIGIDAFGVVDDSPFERAEISESLPMVRVYNETQIAELVSLPEFDLPVTEASQMRRMSYLAEIRREKKREFHSGDNLSFLRSCHMTMKIRHPATEPEIRRCLELIQRSNQLNLSTHRYTEEEFRGLLKSEVYACYLMECGDRFGSYGIVAFSAIRRDDNPIISELVISCRIAKKRVEHAFLRWVAVNAQNHGATRLIAKLVRTDRNGPLASVFQETPFDVVSEDEREIEYQLDLSTPWPDEHIVSIGDFVA